MFALLSLLDLSLGGRFRIRSGGETDASMVATVKSHCLLVGLCLAFVSLLVLVEVLVPAAVAAAALAHQ